MTRYLAIAAVVLALAAGIAEAAPFTLNEVGGDPVVVRMPNGSYDGPGGLTMRYISGTLYSGSSSSGWHYLYKRDSTVTKLLSDSETSANNPDMGTVNQTSGGYKYGSVASGASVSAGAAYAVNPAWNPTTDTIMTLSGGSTWRLDEVVAQTASEGLGVVNEGTAVADGGPTVGTAALASSVSVASPAGYLRTGMSWAENVDVGGTDYDRVFIVHNKPGTNDNGRYVRVLELTDTIAGWDATNAGTRSSGLRLFNDSTSDSLLLDEAAYGALVDDASDESIRDIEVYDGKLYILSYSGTTGKTYLSAVEYDLPTDGTSAVSVTGVVELDPAGGKDYLVLDDQLAGINGWGLAFDAASDATTMFVGGRYDTTEYTIYTFSVTPVPEPATMALLAFGGLALAGSAVRRRR